MSQTAVIPKATKRMRPTAVVSKMGTTHSMIGRAHRRLVALLDSTPTRLRSVISTASVTDTHTSRRDASTKPDAPSIFRWFPAIESAFLWSITGTPNLKFVRACARTGRVLRLVRSPDFGSDQSTTIYGQARACNERHRKPNDQSRYRAPLITSHCRSPRPIRVDDFDGLSTNTTRGEPEQLQTRMLNFA